ncbi:alpha/beta hydrolase [Jannaschia sp. W003]|uniref:alpha/beta hydrolase n=1 Tax=Jannaschia sp. W003 TaxID=2867012 RepID=UPI0021A32DEF|nr:dienelactone hydrolase family protein [Jannaschia sp. W003]UWQ21334.1 dienelactone hydrolase family protein [Jannaschia sp. W003]
MRGLVLLHGRGGSAADMRGLVPLLGAEGMAVAAPEADGHSWWPTSFLAPSAEMEPWVERGIAAVEDAVDSLGLPREEVAVLGFSQGACLALEYMARRGAGGVVAFSGGLVGTGDAGGPDAALGGYGGKAFDYRTDLVGAPALVTCHERDPHIPLARARESAAVLERLGAAVRLVAHPGAGHQPMPDGLAAARALLAE